MLNQSLKKIATPTELEQKETLAIPEIESWQLKILAIKKLYKNC